MRGLFSFRYKSAAVTNSLKKAAAPGWGGFEFGWYWTHEKFPVRLSLASTRRLSGKRGDFKARAFNLFR
jgi:hypothetical protein